MLIYAYILIYFAYILIYLCVSAIYLCVYDCMFVCVYMSVCLSVSVFFSRDITRNKFDTSLKTTRHLLKSIPLDTEIYRQKNTTTQ